MSQRSEAVEPIRWTGDTLHLLDQRRLPHEVTYVACRNAQEVATAIRDMVVRGAPAIGVSAAFGIALAAKNGDDVVASASELRSARPTAVVISGDIAPEVALDLARRAFAGWQRGHETQRPRVTPNSIESSKIYIVDRPQAVQSEIRIGHIGVPRSTEDYFAISVMNSLLGGVFNSRINLNLREKHGYTYGARSTFAFRREAGPFVVSAPVRNEVTRESIDEVLAELRRIRTGDIEDLELNDTKSFLIGVFPAMVQSSSDIAGRLVDMELYGLPENYFDRYRENIGAISKDDIARVANKYIDPERVLIVVVGNAAQIREPLGGLGYPLHEIDVEGNLVVG